MQSILITFPTGAAIRARVLEQEEPALAADLLGKLQGPLELVCNHALSAGKLFDAYMRPAQEPPPLLEGKHPRPFAALAPGDILWDGERLRVAYGETPQPGQAGCVVARAEPGPAFEKACTAIWHGIYREHTVSVITISKGEDEA